MPAHGVGAGAMIYSPGEKSPQRGPLVLQRPIPAISAIIATATSGRSSSAAAYSTTDTSAYGDINISIQGNILARGLPRWKFIETYDRLKERCMGRTLRRTGHVVMEVTSKEISRMVREFDLVINTAPLGNLLLQGSYVPLQGWSEITHGALISEPARRYHYLQRRQLLPVRLPGQRGARQQVYRMAPRYSTGRAKVYRHTQADRSRRDATGRTTHPGGLVHGATSVG